MVFKTIVWISLLIIQRLPKVHVKGGWSTWTSVVGICSVTCGGPGILQVTLTRNCTNPASDEPCVGDTRKIITKECDLHAKCPVGRSGITSMVIAIIAVAFIAFGSSGLAYLFIGSRKKKVTQTLIGSDKKEHKMHRDSAVSSKSAASPK